ncbi:MAG TPA: peptidoglycan-binding domain-containing protein [Pseudonocardiaceae bacterium]
MVDHTGGGTVSVVRKRRRRALLVAATGLGVLLIAAAVGFTHLASRTAAEGSVIGPDPAQTATVQRHDLVRELRVQAEVGHEQPRRLTGRRPGTITWLPEPGTVVRRGERLYEVDAVAVPLFYGTAPLHRPLSAGVPEGADVRLVQENLTALGFPARPDGVFGPATAAAVKSWQKSRGVPRTGTLDPGDVMVAAGEVRVDGVTAQPGDQGTGQILTVTGTGRVAVARIAPEDQELMRIGTAVRLTAPGSTVTTMGTVTSVAPEPAGEPTGGAVGGAAGGGSQKYLVTIRFDDQEAAGALLDGVSLTALVDSERRDGVLAVPVAALLALREGGYAVEVADPATGGRRLVAVVTGLFANGLVEVSGDGLTEGATVVVAS